jgi:hypothetical protein
MPMYRAELINRNLYYPKPRLHDKSLVLYLPFDKDDGSYARDRSGYNNHGTIYGAISVAGIVGKALSFDGVDDYVWIPHDASQDLKTALSLAVWVYRAEAITGWIINKNYDSSGNTQYGFYIDSYNNIQFVLNGAVRVGYGINILGRWARIVCTWDGSTARIYVDGQLKTSASYSATLTSQPYAITVGCRKTTGGVAGAYFHKGLIDEVRIYNRALTAEEIRRIMYMRGV